MTDNNLSGQVVIWISEYMFYILYYEKAIGHFEAEEKSVGGTIKNKVCDSAVLCWVYLF